MVGLKVADEMRSIRDSELLGSKLVIHKCLFTVIGVLEDAPETYALPFDLDADVSVFVPAHTIQRIFPGTSVSLLIARISKAFHYTAAIREIRSYFSKRPQSGNLEITSAQQLIKQMESQLALMTLLLGAIGSISLVVGGIGVMNIMLISVTERKREIGIRRALGARRLDIQIQFLAEAMILTIMGGFAGAVVGTVITYIICQFTDWAFFLSSSSIVFGVVVASIVGLFFGFQPAFQAARLDPIEALQGE